MRFDYAGLRDGAVEDIISNFGQVATLIEKGVTAYDPDTRVSTESTVNHNIKGVLDNQQKSYQDGKLITDTRKRFIVSPKDMTVTPKVNDEITVNGETIKITEVIETKPADVVVLYELVLEN